MANEVAKTEGRQPTAAERFTERVMSEYQNGGMPYQFTDKEQRLIRNYFVCIDQMLQKTEAERVRKNGANKNHDYDNALPYSWKTVDLPQLAQDLAHYARIGLDMMEDNTLFPIPYKNSKGNMYTVTLMEGYNGLRYQAEKYALDPFKSVTVEVIYSNDIFKPIKKSAKNPVEGYEFDIPSPFDRGKPVGVFGYVEFEDASKNKLLIFSEKDVMKRKPAYASPEFWGGVKKVWENGRPVETQVEGWLPEMFEKTMKRAIYGSKTIPRDPAKIDDSYQYVKNRQAEYVDIAVEAEVEEKANANPVTLPEPEKTIEIQPEKPKQEQDAKEAAPAPTEAPVDDNLDDETPF